MRTWAIAGVAVMFLAAGAMANGWTGASSIRDESFYVPSSGLTLGAWTTVWSGVEGYAITDPFQLNLEYQAGILDKDIANFNTYLYPSNPAFPADHTDGDWEKNFSDNDEYVLDVDSNGGLTLYTYPDVEETGGSEIQWTLTGWHQTILAGDIVDNGDGTSTLRVLPTATYRPFPGDPPVNNVEIFDGLMDCEVIGYTFTGACGDIGEGSSLEAKLIPEPATGCLLLAGLFGLSGAVRRRARARR